MVFSEVMPFRFWVPGDPVVLARPDADDMLERRALTSVILTLLCALEGLTLDRCLHSAREDPAQTRLTRDEFA
jgi:hypothetical protein